MKLNSVVLFTLILIIRATVLNAQQAETLSTGKCKYTVYYSPVRESYNSILLVSFKIICDNIAECGKEGNLLVMYQYPVNSDWGKPDHGVYCKCGEWSEETMIGQPGTNPQRKYRIHSIGGMVVTRNDPDTPAPVIKQADNYYISEANKILSSDYSECQKFKKIDSLLWKVRDDKIRPQAELSKAWDTINSIWNKQQPKCDAEKLKKKETTSIHDSIRICYRNGHDCGYYKGSIIKGKANGKGIWKYIEGDIEVVYEGDFIDNIRNGQGTETYRQKAYDNIPFEEKFEGSWKNDCRNGYGIEIKKSKDKTETYKGYFLNDLYNGQGSLTTDNGSKCSGEFKDGFPFNGIYYLVHEDKSLTIFYWENGTVNHDKTQWKD